jgi:uncharacterized delta-60 repeat protein
MRIESTIPLPASIIRLLMRAARFRRSFALAFLGVALTAHRVGAAHLDLMFGINGKVTTDVSGRVDEVRAVRIQPDGRIVAAGVAGAAPRRDFALARYNTDGTLDPAFGDGGTVVTDFAGGDDAAWAVTIQPDRKIVVGGLADGDFALVRYQNDR